MPAGSFIDTNIWVYAHLRAPDEPRHPLALAFARQLKNGVISPQVVAEYYSVMLRNGKEDPWIQTNLIAIFNYTRLQPLNASVVQGNHDTLPIPKTFPDRSPLSAAGIRLKARPYRFCGARIGLVDSTFY